MEGIAASTVVPSRFTTVVSHSENYTYKPINRAVTVLTSSEGGGGIDYCQ